MQTYIWNNFCWLLTFLIFKSLSQTFFQKWTLKSSGDPILKNVLGYLYWSAMLDNNSQYCSKEKRKHKPMTEFAVLKDEENGSLRITLTDLEEF